MREGAGDRQSGKQTHPKHHSGTCEVAYSTWNLLLESPSIYALHHLLDLSFWILQLHSCGATYHVLLFYFSSNGNLDP